MEVISLAKAETYSLSKNTGMTKGLFGLGWKPIRRGKRVDLDASCLGIDENGNGAGLVFYNAKVGFGGAVSLDGDDLSGADDGEGANAPDETITIDLEMVPDHIKTLLLIVNSFSGQTFGAVEDVFCRVTDYFSHQDLVEYDLDAEYSDDTAVVIAKLQRSDEDWSLWNFTAVGKGFKGGLQEIGGLYGLNLR